MPFDTETEDRPFHAEAEAIVARQQEQRAKHVGGACWSAMTSPAAEVEDVETVRQRLVQQDEQNRAWAKSPRGRLYGAITELRAISYEEEAYTLEAIYRGSLADEREAAPADAVARSIRILNTINHPTARDGIAALTELLAPLAVAA